MQGTREVQQLHRTNPAEEALLSIIVPVYNIEEYLPRCVHSLTAQTYKKLEILLVDDGSTDGTGALCDALAKEDERIRVFHKENGGSSSARNLGLTHARGAFIGFVDSDDYVDPQMYERLYEAAVRYGVPVAQAARDEIDEEGNLLPFICEPPKEEELWNTRDFLKELLMHRGDCSFCTKLIRREAFANHSFPPGVLNEDFHLLLEMMPELESRAENPAESPAENPIENPEENPAEAAETARSPRFLASLPDIGYHVFYRIGSNSRKKSRNQFSRVYGDNVDNADYAGELVKERFPEDEELNRIAFRFGIFQRLDYLLHIPVGMMRRPAEEDPDWNTYFQYREVVKYLRRNWWGAMRSPYLTKKNKIYATLFVIAPRGVRVVHKKLKHIED